MPWTESARFGQSPPQAHSSSMIVWMTRSPASTVLRFAAKLGLTVLEVVLPPVFFELASAEEKARRAIVTVG